MLSHFRTYQLAKNFYLKGKELKLKGALRDQFYRASLSIVLNLAEGNDRKTQKDRMKFFRIALTSLRECQTIIDIEGIKVMEPAADVLGAHLYRLVHSNRNLRP